MKRITLATRRPPLHPWVFRRMVAGTDDGVRDGDEVAALTEDGEFCGRGLWNSRSEIAWRRLTWDEDASVDQRLLAERFRRAAELREKTLNLPAITEAWRVINSEGDGLSGLVVDRYNDCFTIELHSLGWHRRLKAVTRLIETTWRPRAIVVRADDRTAEREGFELTDRDQPWKRSDPEAEAVTTVFKEHGLTFGTDLVHGHKTGGFLDQRANRRRFADLARGATVLDLFCHTGGFSMYALAGGARSATAVDFDIPALDQARVNARTHDFALDVVHADVFDFLRDAEQRGHTWDRVVCDPPRLARGRGEVDRALRKYHDLNRLAMRAVRPGGLLLTCSCSSAVEEPRFLETLRYAAADAERTVQVLEITGPGPDHPWHADCPESRYLKAVLCRIQPR